MRDRVPGLAVGTRLDCRATRASPIDGPTSRRQIVIGGLSPLLPEEREEIGTTHQRPVGERFDDELARARLGVYALEDDLAL